jgi:hypothetical protein
MCCRIRLYDESNAAYGGVEVVQSVVRLACPPGRSRRCARPAAVLARAGLAGAGQKINTVTSGQPRSLTSSVIG